MSISQLTQAPSELHFITKDGGEVVYSMSALTDKDESELDEYVQARFIDNVRRSLPDDLHDKDEAQWRRIMTLAMEESLGLRYSRRPGSRVFTTTKGVARLAWQGIKRNHKDVTIDQIHELMYDPRNVLEVYQHYDKVNRWPVRAKAANDNANGGKADKQNFPPVRDTPESSS